jgi:hypothetical protein
MGLQERQEFESFHLKAQTGINNQNDDISNFREVNHGADIVGTLDDGDALFFIGSEGNGTVDLIYFVFGEVLD